LRLGDGSSAGFDFAGTLIVDGTDFQDGPDIVVVRDSDLAQLGLLTMIEPGGRLVADNGVEVGSGERLAGSGAVDGNVVVLSGGQVSPGASPGALGTDAGDVTLQPGAIYTSEVNGLAPGTQYDQVNVEGDVTVDGAVLQLEGGRFQPPKGTVFTLISNDGADPVQGTFRDSQGRALTEGATVKFGGTTAKISYVGGPGGNDVTLTVVDSVFVRNQTTDVTLVGGAVLPRDSERQLAPRQTPRTVLASDSTQSARQSQGFDSRTAALEVRTAQRLRVFFRLVNEGTGQEEPKEYELDPGVLRDLLATFKRFRFQDGRYRIYLQEPGKRERLILDVNVMEGKVVPPNFREAEISPGASAPQEPGADASEADAFDLPPDANPAPAEKTPVGNELEPAAAASSGSPGGAGSQASLTLAVGAAAAVAAMPDWQDRVRTLLASGEIPRTKFSRLLRRIRPR
jgi:hypothetical protein